MRDQVTPLRLLPGEVQAQDTRVVLVREVLAGESVSCVAGRGDVDPVVLHRWVQQFVDAGTRAVTNAPDAQAAAQRDRFLAAFAHELRTPLAVGRGWLDVIADGDLPPQQLDSVMGRLQKAYLALENRINDVELLVAASLGRLTIRREAVAASALFEASGLHPQSPSHHPAFVDPDLFTRVLRDMWGAANLEPAPSTVQVESHETTTWTEFRVTRTGSPLSPSRLQGLFEPFDLDDDTSGITFGLYLARALTVAHGGVMGLEQTDETLVLWARVPRPANHSTPPMKGT
ncbi:HAMP domain-containing sensor histidine kinase [Pedococcus sp. KACC 23699]|uniref:histidine kinase n=1 Tax=Pedococcus sp. KACC 23699 TaxID=3149228 RepID=A0AAU7JTS1_9MICO